MEFIYFLKCDNKGEANNRLRFFRDNFPEEIKKSKQFKAEFDLIKSGKVKFPIEKYNGTYYTDEFGYQKYREGRKYTRKQVLTNEDFIRKLATEIFTRDGNMAALYYKFLQYLKDTDREAYLKDFEYIGLILAYNPGWAKIVYDEYLQKNSK